MTSGPNGKFQFVLAMVAEEESHMKSEAMLLSLEWRFSHGRFLTPRLFGFDKVEVPDGFGWHRKILQINESEANVVRWMYSALLSGMMPDEIAGILTDLAINAVMLDIADGPALSFDMRRALIQTPSSLHRIFIPGSVSA